jgi:hypothetical protein
MWGLSSFLHVLFSLFLYFEDYLQTSHFFLVVLSVPAF